MSHAVSGCFGNVQGYNGMGMPGMMNGYGNYGNFYQGFNGGYPNMNGYQFNPYSFAVAGTGEIQSFVLIF